MFEGGFEILRLGIFRHYDEFSWNAYFAPPFGPNVRHLLDDFNFMIIVFEVILQVFATNSLTIHSTQKLVVGTMNM